MSTELRKEYPRRSLPTVVDAVVKNDGLDEMLDSKLGKLEESILTKIKEVIDEGIRTGLDEIRKELVCYSIDLPLRVF